MSAKLHWGELRCRRVYAPEIGQQGGSPYSSPMAGSESGDLRRLPEENMMKSQMPIWFSPYVWIPLMAMFYVVFPLYIWDFSPDILTHSMPYFLVGGSDWGGGNVFAFTKLVFWMSMIGGAVATCRISVAAHARTMSSILAFIFRNYAWHGLAAFSLVSAWKLNGSTPVGDLWSLTAYLFAGVVAIVLTARGLEKRGQPAWRIGICMTISILWGFVPIGRG